MNTRIERIVRQTDGHEPAGALSPTEAAQAETHRAMGALLKQAYSFKPANAPLAFMGERVLARVRADEPVGFAVRLQALWTALVGHPVLALSGMALVLALAVAVSFRPANRHSAATATAAQPAHMRSFIIYDTPDGNGFFQCVEYESVSHKSNANESS